MDHLKFERLYSIRNDTEATTSPSMACNGNEDLGKVSALLQKFTGMKYHDVAKLEDLEPGTCLSIELDDAPGVALFNVDGEILALDNTCPHAGGPLGEGTLDGEVVECPWHGWEFNVRTGQCIENPTPEWAVPCYRTRVENGVIQVAFPTETP